jgi:hypothetical protein
MCGKQGGRSDEATRKVSTSMGHIKQVATIDAHDVKHLTSGRSVTAVLLCVPTWLAWLVYVHRPGGTCSSPCVCTLLVKMALMQVGGKDSLLSSVLTCG